MELNQTLILLLSAGALKPNFEFDHCPTKVAKKLTIYNYNEILMLFEALTGIEPSKTDWVFLSMDDHHKVIFFGNIFDIPWKQNTIWIQSGP